MRGIPTRVNVRTMKKAPVKRSAISGKSVRAPQTNLASNKRADEMRPHYEFDYSQSRPNRFAARSAAGSVVVVLDPDVASVFQSAEAVNTFLRSVLSAMPQTERPKKRRVS
jgi:hypothetical protein